MSKNLKKIVAEAAIAGALGIAALGPGAGVVNAEPPSPDIPAWIPWQQDGDGDWDDWGPWKPGKWGKWGHWGDWVDVDVGNWIPPWWWFVPPPPPPPGYPVYPPPGYPPPGYPVYPGY